MEKINNFIKKNYFNILLFIIIAIIISPYILQKPLNNLDEIWIYGFCKNVADGLVPYRDFNMVTTPLLPFICSIFLNIFGNNLFTMRILAIILITFLFFMMYLILKKLKVNRYIIYIALLSWFIIFKDYICIDYNFMVLAIILFIIYLELSHHENTLFYFFIGILCSLCILLKQTTGLFVAFASIIYPILFIVKQQNSKINGKMNKSEINTINEHLTFKNYMKITLVKILGIAIPLIALLIYLLINNALADFIDYSILGIKTFSNNIPYTRLITSSNLVIQLLSIILPIFLIVSGIYALVKKQKKLYGFFAYSVASLIVVYPISDAIHFLIGFTPTFILLVYFLYNALIFIKEKCISAFSKHKKLINKNLKIKKVKVFIQEFCKCIIILFIIMNFINSIHLIHLYILNTEKDHEINHYKYIPLQNGIYTKIKTIQQYIINEENDVYMFDAETSMYMISLDIYHKDMDFFNKGNVGSKGDNGQIEKIKNMKNSTKILIRNDKYTRNWQTPESVITYIKDNLTKIGEISIFDIYEKNF